MKQRTTAEAFGAGEESQSEDAVLLARCGQGDAGAFARFVERHQAAVFRYLQATLHNDSDAEDALQETFVAAWRSAANYQGTGSGRAWVLGIARNSARRQRRRRVGEPQTFVELDTLGIEAGWGIEDPDQLLIENLRREWLEAAMHRLSETDREVLVLRDLEGLDGETVAGMLGLEIPAMKSRLHRARLRLAAEVRKEREYA